MGKLTIFILTIFISSIFIGSCNHETIDNKRGNGIVIDDLSREIKLKNCQKVLSLTPSITEMLYTFVESDRIIGRTPYDSIPAQVLPKPVVNNYPPDFEKIIFLKPDIVFAKEGMISLGDAKRLQELGIPVYIQKYDSISDIFRGMEDLGKLLKKEPSALKVVDSLKNKLKLVEEPCLGNNCPKVLLMIEEKPIFVYGLDNYATDLIEAAGGINAIDKVFDNPFPSISREYLLKINPDIIIGADSSNLLELYPELSEVNAIRKGKVFQTDMEPISRPGPRFVDGISLLKTIIHEY